MYERGFGLNQKYCAKSILDNTSCSFQAWYRIFENQTKRIITRDFRDKSNSQNNEGSAEIVRSGAH